MKTQTIEVEVPDGYRIKPHTNKTGMKITFDLEKIQPRRIVLESSTDIRKAVFGDWIYNNGVIEQWSSQKESQSTYRIWREVKETNEEHYLKLTKKDMLELIEHIKLGGQLNNKIAEFIKENS